MPAKGKKGRVRRLKPFEKMEEFVKLYQGKCALYDTPQLEQVDDLYSPLIIKKARKPPVIIQFAENAVAPTQIRPLVEAYKETDIKVKFFSFINTQSGDEGLHVLSHSLEPPLEVAGLSYVNNGVGPSGCRAIARAMVQAKFLAILELDFNSGIGDVGAASIAHYGHCPTLIKLSLRFCSIGDEGATAIAKWLAKPECQIKEILLNGNQIGPIGAIAIGENLKQNQSLNRLDLSDNVFGYDVNALNALYDGIKENPTLNAVSLYNNYECPEGMDEKFQTLVTEKPLGEFLLTTKMDGVIFQNTRAISMINKKKIVKEMKKKPKPASEAAVPQQPVPTEVKQPQAAPAPEPAPAEKPPA